MIFNRPEPTKRVFAEIAKQRPKKLLVVADGPRKNHPNDAKNCEETRRILKEINWDCEVLTNLSDENLGCKKRVTSGISWVFTQVESAIILEDDVLPSESFFSFCAELLERYKNDSRVMMISGTQFHPSCIDNKYSYSFSRWPQIWGWATWRRAWQTYDADLTLWPDFKDEQQLKNAGLGFESRLYWDRIFEKMYQKKVDTWDHQWSFNMISNGGLAIQPNVNLITNIGFGETATHTKVINRYANMERSEIPFPLIHPKFVLPSARIDTVIRKRTQGILYKIFNSTRIYFETKRQQLLEARQKKAD